jgi:hypothetical protein
MRHKPPPDLRPFLDGPLYTDLALPVLLAAMTTAVLAGGVVFLRQTTTADPWGYLYLAVFLIALETIYTGRWLNLPEQRPLNKMGYRLAEFLVVALVLRLLTWPLMGGPPGLSAWRGYLLEPINFLDPVYFVYLVFAGLTMAQAGRLADIFHRLALSDGEINYYTMSEHARLMSGHEKPPLTDRTALRQQFFEQWLIGGFIIGLLTAATAFDIAASETGGLRTIVRLGVQPEMLLALMVYFLTGFWLVSHARLAAMRARWLINGVIPHEALARSWRRGSLAVVVGAALLASFLPIGGGFAFSHILETVFRGLIYASAAILNVVIFIFAAFLALLLGWIGKPVEEATLTETPAPTPPPPPVIPADPVEISQTAALIIGGLFWTVMAVIAISAVLYFLHGRGYRFNRASFDRLRRRMRDWLAGLRRNLAESAAAARKAASGRWRRKRPSTSPNRPAWRFFRLNALSPREQVRYFYLSTARRAEEKGTPRAPQATPLEYARDLEAHWPAVEEDIEALTAAFVAARYGREPIDQENLNPIKATWKRIRAAFAAK